MALSYDDSDISRLGRNCSFELGIALISFLLVEDIETSASLLNITTLDYQILFASLMSTFPRIIFYIVMRATVLVSDTSESVDFSWVVARSDYFTTAGWVSTEIVLVSEDSLHILEELTFCSL